MELVDYRGETNEQKAGFDTWNLYFIARKK
jgi:hypothetical protein